MLLPWFHGSVLEEILALVLAVTTHNAKKFDSFCSEITHNSEIFSKTMWSYFS